MFGIKFLLGVSVCAGLLSAPGEAAEPNSAPHKSTNVTVESSKLEPFSIDEKTEPENKRATFYSDQNSSVDINENGEPNLNMRF